LSSYLSGPTICIGLAIAREFAERNDAEVVIWCRSKQRTVQPAKEISSKSSGAKLVVTDISGIVHLLEEIMGIRYQIYILGNNVRYHFDGEAWSKKRNELGNSSEVLRGPMRTFRNIISTTIGTNRRTKQNGTRCGGVMTASHPLFLRISMDPLTFSLMQR